MKPRLIYDQFGQAYISYWYAFDPLGELLASAKSSEEALLGLSEGVRRMQVRFGLDLSQTYRRVERW